MSTTASLDFLPRRVRLDIDDLWMRSGPGGHEMRFQLKLHAPWLPDDTADSVEVLNLQSRIDASGSASPQPLGGGTLSCLVRRFPTTEQLHLVITDEQLQGLEAMRGEGTVEFLMDLTATLSDRNDPRPSWTSTQVRYSVTPSRWLEILDQVGAGATITVRVPSPLTDASPDGAPVMPDSKSASQAARRLREARRLLRDGNYERCVQTCRSVLDNLKQLSPPTSVSQLRGIQAPRRDQTQRWSAIFHDLYSLCSAANHDDEITRNFAWSRSDAQAALAMTAALLARVPLP